MQDAFGTAGTNPTLGVNELTAFNAIGYGLLNPVPEPATFGLLGASLLALGVRLARKNSRI